MWQILIVFSVLGGVLLSSCDGVESEARIRLARMVKESKPDDVPIARTPGVILDHKILAEELWAMTFSPVQADRSFSGREISLLMTGTTDVPETLTESIAASVSKVLQNELRNPRSREAFLMALIYLRQSILASDKEWLDRTELPTLQEAIQELETLRRKE
jgi:hypothetical protein